MPNDPRKSRFVTVNGHTGTLVIDTHTNQPEIMSTTSENSEQLEEVARERNKWREAALKLAMAVEAGRSTKEHTDRIQKLSAEEVRIK
jgi:hypothetical protein